MAKGNGMTIDGETRAPARETDGRLRGAWEDSGAVTCRSCHYPNPVSHSFYALSVQNLYCRKCGRMINREGRLVVPS